MLTRETNERLIKKNYVMKKYHQNKEGTELEVKNQALRLES